MSVRATKPTSDVSAPPELHITLSDAAPLESAGAAVRACALSKGFMAERATRLQVVVEELIRECRKREAVSTSPSDVSVEVSFDGTNLDVAVSDQRLPLSAEQSRHLPSRRLLGLGFADHLHIAFAGAAGNVATCRLTMASTYPDDLHHTEMLEPDAPDAPGAEQVEIDVRPMTPADAEGLLQCVFRCYGYTYPNQSMYQAAAIRRMLESGSMISVVAIAPSGERAGLRSRPPGHSGRSTRHPTGNPHRIGAAHPSSFPDPELGLRCGRRRGDQGAAHRPGHRRPGVRRSRRVPGDVSVHRAPAPARHRPRRSVGGRRA